MAVNKDKWEEVVNNLQFAGATLVAVSKIKPASAIKQLYDLGQKDFGENYMQELVEKQAQLPLDIRWHFIGHLQTNKVKYIAPFVHLIHGVDSEKLLLEINKQGKRNNRIINCLLQVHIAKEETKFGFNADEVAELLGRIISKNLNLDYVNIKGLMGMASFSDDENLLKEEFAMLSNIFKMQKASFSDFDILSMGMSADYKLALQYGSTMVRIGSLLFGARN